MTAAQQLASNATDTPERVAALVRQKLGSDRMDLWFGADAKWSVLDHNVILEVSSQFVADCISRMFREICSKRLRRLLRWLRLQSHRDE